MKILLSPAKSLDYTTTLPSADYSKPAFMKEANQINEVLKNYSVQELSELMKLSEKLARLNVDRYKEFSTTSTLKNARPAIFAFSGDVYTGFDAYSLPQDLYTNMQDKIRILSGMYGYLRPLDLLQAYRLEMGTKLPVGEHKNLYAFWKDIITPHLNSEIKNDELVVNLASNEYFKVINKKELKGQLVSPVFKDYKNGKLKVISFFAKKARGSMARFLVENKASNLEDVLAFQKDEYRYSQKDTQSPNEPVFIR